MSEPIRPFSNGTEYGDWQASNCERCKKAYFPDEAETICEIFYALDMASFLDGTISEDIARRMGFLDHPESYVWPCGEVDWTEEWKQWKARVKEASHE